ncbi:MAG: MBL fold metallo-hydrolase [Candidatus Neptunochlamydia sp.]|nr:MBL fold metallo-hydrolase [Candidatus Neptunochlamydia sp.]
MNQLKVAPLHVCSGIFKNYSYLVFDQGSNNALVIDPAWELEKYLEVFNDFGVTPTHILLTHTHFDHIELVDYFAGNFKTKIWVSKNERNRLPFTSDLIRTFSHMDALNLNGLDCTAFLTPGHSPGSSCFLIGSNLFSGDTLFIEGCGICDEPDANPEHLYESLMFIKNEFSLDVKVYPGHRFQACPGKTMEYVLANNIYLHFKTKKEFVDFRMRNNQLNFFDFK